MDYIFQDTTQTFDEELSYLFDNEVKDVPDSIRRDYNNLGYLFDKEDIQDVLENNQKSIKKRLKQKLEKKDKKKLKDYRKELQNKGYSNKKIKQLLKKKKKQLKN